jgi:Uma2 family endonuclease
VHAPEVFHTRARRLSRAEYDRMAELGFFHGQRVELIHGIPVWMPPIGPAHADVVDRLTALLVRGIGDRARVRIQQPFVAHDESEPEPDVAVVPPRNYASGHPESAFLIIEVAETSLEYDRETKAALYAASEVAEYWIVNLQARAIEIHAEASVGRYSHVSRATANARISPRMFPDIVVSLDDLVG